MTHMYYLYHNITISQFVIVRLTRVTEPTTFAVTVSCFHASDTLALYQIVKARQCLKIYDGLSFASVK